MITVIDARNKPQPHDCGGSWQLLGRNQGGHEIQVCDRGEDGSHVIISRHADRRHECGRRCAQPVADISTRQQLQEVMRLLSIPADWHEPDQWEISATVHGKNLDNAGFYGAGYEDAIHGEYWVTLGKDGQPLAEVNLATLLGIASGYDYTR